MDGAGEFAEGVEGGAQGAGAEFGVRAAVGSREFVDGGEGCGKAVAVAREEVDGSRVAAAPEIVEEAFVQRGEVVAVERADG